MKRNRNILLMVLCLMCMGHFSFAQREHTRTVTATGTYVASMDETPAYGQARALAEAKKQALREAGVTEDISSTTILVLGGANNSFHEISSELSRIELEGRVRVKKQTDAPPAFTDDKLVKYSTTIIAEVIVEESEEDLQFQFKTEGLQNTYRSGDPMNFTITPTKDCYLRIFFFGKHPSANAQVYPIEGIFKDIQLKAGVSTIFPPNIPPYLYDIPFEYTMELEDERENVEQDVILIVALKKAYPFVEEVTYENVISWLSKMKRSEKCVLWEGVNIVKR